MNFEFHRRAATGIAFSLVALAALAGCDKKAPAPETGSNTMTAPASSAPDSSPMMPPASAASQ